MADISLSQIKAAAAKKRDDQTTQLSALGYIRLPNGSYVRNPNFVAPTASTTGQNTLSAADLQKYTDANGNLPPPDATPDFLAKNGYKLSPGDSSTTAQQTAKALANANSSLDELYGASNNINKAKTGDSATYLGQVLTNFYKSHIARNDKDITTLNNTGPQLLSIIKGLTSSSRILQSEITNIKLPSPYDTKTEAQTKLNNIKKILNDVKQEPGNTGSAATTNQSSTATPDYGKKYGF